jgi:acid phosphatase family membrane protein YuiD
MFLKLIHNEILLIAVLSWFFAQFAKFIINIFKFKKVDIGFLFASGGMPSSHSSTVTSLATAVGFKEGFDSALFAISCIMAIIVMYDASGVRLAVSKQAKILNEMFEKKSVTYKKLNELVGHTPIQVFVGAILGIAIAILYHLYVT